MTEKNTFAGKIFMHIALAATFIKLRLVASATSLGEASITEDVLRGIAIFTIATLILVGITFGKISGVRSLAIIIGLSFVLVVSLAIISLFGVVALLDLATIITVSNIYDSFRRRSRLS